MSDLLARRVLMRAGLAGLGALALAPLRPAASMAASAMASGGFPPPPPAFRIFRKGTDIGGLTMSFRQHDGMLMVVSQVTIAVRILGVVVYRYSQRFEENWREGQLVTCQGQIDRNGTIIQMAGAVQATNFLMRTAAGDTHLPLNAAPLSWWNKGNFSRPLFDIDDGKLLHITLKRSAEPGGGERIEVEGDAAGAASYAADGQWTGWTTSGTQDGSSITYKPAS